MSKKINLEYHSSKESLFINHLQKLEDSITDSHPKIDGDNWDDLSTCIDIIKGHALSDELIIRFTKLGAFLQDTGLIIGQFYEALLGLNQEQLSKALKEISTFKYKLSENAREYLFDKVFTDNAASKFNTAQMAELICNLSISNSKTWAKKATEFMTHLSSLKDETQQNYSIIWQRYVEPEMAFEFFKGIDIKEYLTPLNAYSQARVIEKIFELKNLKEASDLLSKLLHKIKEFIPEMEPSVQETFVYETFDLRTTESGAELAKSLLAEVWADLPKMDRSVSEYIKSNNYFTTSPKKYDPNYEILSASFNTEVFRLLAQKAHTDNNIIKQLILSGNRYFEEIANIVIYSFPGTHLNGEVIKTLILTGKKNKILESFKLSNIDNKKEQIKSVKEIFSLWHHEKKLQEDILGILKSSYVNFFPKVAREVQKAFIEELFDAKGMGIGHFTAFSKENYELLTKLLPQIINALNTADSEIQDWFLAKIFALRNDDYAYLGLPQVLLTLSDQIPSMLDEMLIKLINKLENSTSLREYEIPLKKQIYLKLTNSLNKIKNPVAKNLFIKHLIELVSNPGIIKITIEEILSSQFEHNKRNFMSGVKDLIIFYRDADTLKEIWVQLSKLLPSFNNSTQIKFLEFSFEIIKILKLGESPSFSPVISEIIKLIKTKDPLEQIKMFNELKSMKISKTIFAQALKIQEPDSIQNYLEKKATEWFMERIPQDKVSIRIQISFLENLFEKIEFLDLHEFLLLKPVISEITKLIESNDPLEQLKMFNALKSTEIYEEISKTIFAQALKIQEPDSIQNYLEKKATEWFMERIPQDKVSINTQISFLENLFKKIEILELQEFLSLKPVISEITKLIESKDPSEQLKMFNALKSTEIYEEISKTIFAQALKIQEPAKIHYYLEIQATQWFIDKIHQGMQTSEFLHLYSSMERSLQQKLVIALFNSAQLSPTKVVSLTYLPLLSDVDVQRTFLIELFNNSKTAFNYSNLGMCLERLLELLPPFFGLIYPSNKLYINKAKIFHCHEAGTISDELYQTIINQLGGKDKFFDPSLKLVISQDIDPIVKKLFDKAVYSKDVEGRVKDIALTVDLLVKKDTSGLMRTILEAADLPGKLLMENDLYSKKPNTYLQGSYFPNKDITIFSMKHESNVEVAGTIIHELTHKLLHFIFENYTYPYYNATLSLPQASYLSQILNELVLIPQQHKLFSYYDKDKWNVEVIPHLFQDLATRILTEEDSETVLVLSEKLKNWVESYLKPSLQDFDSAYEVLGSKILDEYSSQSEIFKNWSLKRIDQELEKISNIQKIADEESTDSFDITGTILGYLEPEEATLEVAGES